jgi:hypothetical protein
VCGGESEDDFPVLTPFPTDMASRLHGIRDQVAQLRGLPAHPVAVEGTLSPEQLTAYIAAEPAALSEEERADLEAYGLVLKTLGLIPQDADINQLLFEDSAETVAGIYFPAQDRLVLIAGDSEISIQDEIILAHEYAHSLQDGSFHIEDLEREWAGSDLEEDGFAQYSETLECLIEGDATYTARLYGETVYGPTWREQAQEEAKGATGEEPELPEFLERATSFNYGECAGFVEDLHKSGGWDAVNAAYRSPPATTEQIIDDDKYRSRELANAAPPRDLSDDLEGWKQLDSAQFGAYDVYNYALTLTQDAQLAANAAFGWGAGWINVYRSEADASRVLVQLFLGWDSDQDLLEFLVAYDAIVTKLGAQTQPLEAGKLEWSTATQYGHIARHPSLAAVEIIIAPNKDTAKRVVD